jgi:hypothetical protein
MKILQGVIQSLSLFSIIVSANKTQNRCKLHGCDPYLPASNFRFCLCSLFGGQFQLLGLWKFLMVVSKVGWVYLLVFSLSQYLRCFHGVVGIAGVVYCWRSWGSLRCYFRSGMKSGFIFVSGREPILPPVFGENPRKLEYEWSRIRILVELRTGSSSSA